MSKVLEKVNAKFEKANNGNKLVDAVKFGVSKGFADESFTMMADSSAKLYPLHYAELAAYLGRFGGPEALRDEYFEQSAEGIQAEGDFHDRLTLGQCYAFAGLNDEAISTFEDAFESIEGDSDYMFYAIDGIKAITLGTTIGNPAGQWFVRVPDNEYLASTLNSVLEDFEVNIEAIDEDDRIRYYCTFGKGFLQIGDTEKAQSCLEKAFDITGDSFDYVELLFMEADDEIPCLTDGGVSDEAPYIEFASEAFRKRLIEKAQKLASNPDEKEIAADMAE